MAFGSSLHRHLKLIPLCRSSARDTIESKLFLRQVKILKIVGMAFAATYLIVNEITGISQFYNYENYVTQNQNLFTGA